MFHNYSLDKRAIPMSMVLTLLDWMQAHGFTQEAILAGTGLTDEDLKNPEFRVSYRQRIQQVNNALSLMGGTEPLLRREIEVSISDYGLLGYAMVSSETLGRAVQIAVKYHKTAGAMFDLLFFREDGDAVLRLEQFIVGGNVGQFMTEEIFLGITPLISLLLGKPFLPAQVSLNYKPSTSVYLYEKAFGCEVKMEQAYCEYRFNANLLNERLAAADSNVARSCEDACRKLLVQMDIENDLVSRICHLLLSTPGEFPKLDIVAEKLSIGTRTLRRRLKSLGTSYQKVLDDVKKELAVEYLQTTSLSVQEISDLLGYSEVTNFRRAFVKWVDLSPYQYRRQTSKIEIA